MTRMGKADNMLKVLCSQRNGEAMLAWLQINVLAYKVR